MAVAGNLASRGWRARDLGLVPPWPPRAALLDVARGVLLCGAALAAPSVSASGRWQGKAPRRVLGDGRMRDRG